MIARFLLLSFFIGISITVYSQDVLVSFDSEGCPTDSVRLQLQDQYVLGKFIVNLGEKEVWGNSYVTHYNDVEQITVRGFYEDLTEDISMYEIGVSLEDCDRVFKTDSACLDSEISEVVPTEFSSVDVTFQNVEGFDPNQIYSFAGGESIDYILGRDDALINYTVHLDGYPSASHSHSVTAQLVDLESGEFCREDEITIRSCTGNPNTVFREISGLAGYNDEIGAEYTFEMRQSDVVIEVYDPDLDWTKEIVVRHNNAGKIELIDGVSKSCSGTIINFIDEGSYRLRSYYGEFNILNELNDYYYGFYYPTAIGFYGEPFKLLDTIITGNSFLIDNSLDVYGYTIVVESAESNCPDYDGLYIQASEMEDDIVSTFPNNLFNKRNVSEEFSAEVSISSWKVYNIIHTPYSIVGYPVFGIPVLIAEGTSQEIEFENFARQGLLEINVNENGLCRKYWKEYKNGNSAEFEKFLNDPFLESDQICEGDVEVIKAQDGNNFIFIDTDGTIEVTNSFQVDYEYQHSTKYAAQFGKYESPTYIANSLFKVEGAYCIGEEVSIELCADIEGVAWDVSDLDDLTWPYVLEDDKISFNMPSFDFDLTASAVTPAGWTLIDNKEIKPSTNGFTPSLIQEEELNFCNVIEIESPEEYVETNWYVNGVLVSTETNLTYFLTDFDDLGSDVEVRLEAITASGCDFFDEVDISYEAVINEGELFQIDNTTPHCPEDILSLICPVEFETCRWITKSGSSVNQAYNGVYSEILEVQAIDATGCITRQALDYNVVYADVPLDMCQIAGEPLSGANDLSWESTDDYEMIYIYREENFLGDYQLIDSVAGLFNQYFDDTAMSDIRSYRYKIQYRNICADFSDLENTAFHRTISLAASIGVNDVVNLSWNDYEGLDYLQVNILRGTDPFAMESIATLPKGIDAFIDSAPLISEVVYYAIEVQLGETCEIIQDQPLISNVVQTQIASSVDDVDNDLDLVIYPNPATSTLLIECPHDITNVNIRDIDGKIVGSYDDQAQYDVSNLVSGVYLVMVTTDAGVIVRRVYKE